MDEGLPGPRQAAAARCPADIKDHVRYPQDLFDVQRGLLAQYHITDPVASYNGKGKWAVPADPFEPAAGDQPPFYVLANAPTGTSKAAQFQLTTPMVVNNSNNLASYMSVNSDYGPGYGQISVLQAPTNSVIQGPAQVANVFKSDTQISKDISLLDTGQTRVLHGNLLTLPLGDSFLYVEPLYVQSTSSSSYPTLQRVLVTYGDKIGYGATLADALDDIRLGRSTGASIGALGQTTTAGGKTPTAPNPSSTASSTPTSTPSSSTPSTTPAGTGSVQQLLVQLDQAVTARNAAYDSHNADRIAAAEAKVQKIADQLVAAQSASPSSTPKASPTK